MYQSIRASVYVKEEHGEVCEDDGRDKKATGAKKTALDKRRVTKWLYVDDNGDTQRMVGREGERQTTMIVAWRDNGNMRSTAMILRSRNQGCAAAEEAVKRIMARLTDEVEAAGTDLISALMRVALVPCSDTPAAMIRLDEKLTWYIAVFSRNPKRMGIMHRGNFVWRSTGIISSAILGDNNCKRRH